MPEEQREYEAHFSLMGQRGRFPLENSRGSRADAKVAVLDNVIPAAKKRLIGERAVLADFIIALLADDTAKYGAVTWHIVPCAPKESA